MLKFTENDCDIAYTKQVLLYASYGLMYPDENAGKMYNVKCEFAFNPIGKIQGQFTMIEVEAT